MRSFLPVILAAVGLVAAVPGGASAHAFLDHSVPGVGSTVAASPGELTLTFTEGVEPALSGVRITSSAGAAVPTAKAAADPSDKAVLRVRLSRPLAAGIYQVHWHVVSVDTHPTSGTYKFTVGP